MLGRIYKHHNEFRYSGKMDFHKGIMYSSPPVNSWKPSSVAKPWKSPARRYTGLHACPCGYYGDPLKPCTCSSATVTRYQKRISGPLLDRIDIHVEVPRVDYEKLSDDRLGEPSAKVQARVEAAREVQRQRFNQESPRDFDND